MADDCVFDFGRVQAHLLHSGIDLIFNGVIEDRVEYNDAVRLRERPHGILGLAKPIEIVENFDRFGMPGRSVRRSLRAAPTAALTAAGAPALSRRGANEVE